MDATTRLALTRALASGELVVVRWLPPVATAFPPLAAAVAAFDAGDLPAATACATWLREHALALHREARTYLHVVDGRVVGFYALLNGEAELNTSHRRALGATYATQPAVLLGQIARSVDAPRGTGRELMRDAHRTAALAAEIVAATILALDPYDQHTAEMWRLRYGFRSTRTPAGGLKRLWVPLGADLD